MTEQGKCHRNDKNKKNIIGTPKTKKSSEG